MFTQIVSLAPKPPKISISGPGVCSYCHNGGACDRLEGIIMYLLSLVFSFSDKIGVGEVAKLLITFKSPLSVEMTDVTLNMDVEELSGGKFAILYNMGIHEVSILSEVALQPKEGCILGLKVLKVGKVRKSYPVRC